VILTCICSLAASPGRGIVQLLESLGLQGFPLFLAALAISILVVGASYLIATWGMNPEEEALKVPGCSAWAEGVRYFTGTL
jgi:hypothetical protein